VTTAGSAPPHPAVAATIMRRLAYCLWYPGRPQCILGGVLQQSVATRSAS